MIVRTLLASLLAVASSTVQVAQPGYWDELYAESLRMNVTDFHHSWQGVNFEKLAQVLGDRLQLREDLIVLVLGSGDSLLPEEIHQKGVAEVIAMDLSPQLSRARPPGVRSLMEDARSQTSLEASSVDVIIELGLLDVILAEADVEGAAALLREARRLLCAGGLFISGSTDIPKFRQPLLAEHPAGGWAEAEVLRLDRPLALDRRVKELDPSWEVDRIFIYLNLAAGEVEVGQALRASRTEAATAAAPPPTAEAAAPSPEAATPPAAPVEAAAPSPEAAAPPDAPVEAAAPSPEAAAPPAAPVEAAAPSPEAAAPPAAPVEAAAPAPEAVAPPAAPVEAAAPSPEAAAPPAAPVEAAAPSPEAAAPPAAPVEAAAPSPEAAAPPAAPVEAAAAPPAAPVEAAAPSPEAAAPPAAPVEAAVPSPEAAAPPAAPVEAAAPASSPKSRVEDPAAAFAESIRRLQAQAAALAKP